MDLRSILSTVTTLPEERRKELLEKHEGGTLTDEERQELLDHLFQFIANKEEEKEVAEYLQSILCSA